MPYIKKILEICVYKIEKKLYISNLGKVEFIKDTARVVGSMADLVFARLGAHEELEEIAEWSAVPVVNGLTDRYLLIY